MNCLYLFLLCILMSACGGLPDSVPGPTNKKDLSLKVINYNIWHGLGSGYLKREELEPEFHREQRFEEQLRLFKKEEPDILFLQEINPVYSLSRQIAEDLGMPLVSQQTNCGVSVFGAGLPVNLSIGISILVKPPLEIQKIVGLKLSGPAGFCDSAITFQTSEFRYALFALAYHPQYGSFLLVNTHFHHGVEWSDPVRKKIKSWEDEGVLISSQKSELEKVIEESNLRRKEELQNVFSQIGELQKYYNNLPLIFAGDLNSTINSPIYKTIVETHKLKDSVEGYFEHPPSKEEEGSYSQIPYTWDPVNNEKNHQYTSKFELSVPVFEKPEVEAFFKEYDQRQRRIDYMFVSPDIVVQSHSLFANQPNAQGIIGSDHFGIMVLMTLK